MFYIYAVGAAFVVYFPKPKVDTRKSLLSKGEKENFTEVSIALSLNEFQLCLKYYKYNCIDLKGEDALSVVMVFLRHMIVAS